MRFWFPPPVLRGRVREGACPSDVTRMSPLPSPPPEYRRRERGSLCFESHQIFDDEPFKSLVIAFGDEALPGAAVNAVNEVNEVEEDLLRVLQVQVRFLSGLGAHRLDVQPHDFAMLAVAVANEHVDLVERPAQIHRAERLVL